MASAAARLLHLTGFRVVILELLEPLAVRRLVCFGEAIRAGVACVGGVEGRRVDPADLETFEGAAIAVCVDPEARSARVHPPRIVVDARMRKTPSEAPRLAPFVVGLGPGFRAGGDVDAVIETQRGPTLGEVIWEGSAVSDTGEPAAVSGATHARVLRAPAGGRFVSEVPLGALVERGQLLGRVGGQAVVAGVAGLVRGLLADGVEVAAGLKIGDVDPRGNQARADTISDKASAVAAGVLEAVLRAGLVDTARPARGQ